MAVVPSSDVVALRAALVHAEAEAARTRAVNADLAARVALLELQNEKMRRALYGQRSERGQLLVDQLELGLEELEASAGEDEALGARARDWHQRRSVHAGKTVTQAAARASAPASGSSLPLRRAAPAADRTGCRSWAKT